MYCRSALRCAIRSLIAYQLPAVAFAAASLLTPKGPFPDARPDTALHDRVQYPG